MLTEQLHCTHWLGWRPGKSSLLLNISPCWYVVPLYWQDLAGARSPDGECGSGKEDETAQGWEPAQPGPRGALVPTPKDQQPLHTMGAAWLVGNPVSRSFGEWSCPECTELSTQGKSGGLTSPGS